MMIRIALTVTLLLVAALGTAHDGPGSPPYLYTIDGTLDKAEISSWTAAVKTLVAAHDAHDNGRYWAVFRELTGGPDVRVAFFRGFAAMAELDSWPSTREVLVDVLGPTEGSAVRETLTRGLTSTDRVMARVDELSNPWTGHDAPRYLWVATSKVAEGKMTEYAALAKRVRRAFETHAEHLRWVCYSNTIGGDSAELSCFYGFDDFAEIDAWPSRRAVLAAAYGERDGGRLASAVEAISETTTSLWKLEPSLSRMPE
jgi:hypothetical protein